MVKPRGTLPGVNTPANALRGMISTLPRIFHSVLEEEMVIEFFGRLGHSGTTLVAFTT